MTTASTPEGSDGARPGQAGNHGAQPLRRDVLAPSFRRLLASQAWMWLVIAVTILFVARGATVILVASSEQAELRALIAAIGRLDSLELSLRELGKGVTPAELARGEPSGDDRWNRLLSQVGDAVAEARTVDHGLAAVERCLDEVSEAARRMDRIRGDAVLAAATPDDGAGADERYRDELTRAVDSVEAVVSTLRSRLGSLSLDLADHWRQLSLLVWVSCVVALLTAALSAVYRRDLKRRKEAESALASAQSGLEMRVDERTAELSLANALLTDQIRERRKTEERLQRYADRLARSNAELQEFAYVASHDLQEPLRMVSSYVQLLQRRYQGKLDQDADEFIGFAVDGAERMKQLIRDLLAYARVDSQERVFEAVDCGDVFCEVLQNLKVAVAESRAEVTAGPLPVVTGDRTQLVQLLQNLVANAIRFRGTQLPLIQIDAQVRGDVHLVRVLDNGIGIDRAHFDRIFRVFQRLQPRSNQDGTGIGLAICKKIVERHGGRIWVESEPGSGTTMLFTLPVRSQDPAAASRSASPPESIEAELPQEAGRPDAETVGAASASPRFGRRDRSE